MEMVRDASSETVGCPFCGNNENKYRSLMALMLGRLRRLPVHFIKCESCGSTGPISVEWPDPETAIETWNKRAFIQQEVEPDIEKVWREFWAPLVIKDGQLDLDQVKRELFDFHLVMGEVSKVYDALSGGAISKPNTEATVVIAVVEDRFNELIEDPEKIY